MEDILERIASMSRSEIQILMRAIPKWFAEHYPDWNVIYIALHRDPELRRKDYDGLLAWIEEDMQRARENL